MNIHASYFPELIKQEWNYPSYGDDSEETQLILRSPDADVSGGKIKISDIDELANINTKIRRIDFDGKKIRDMDISFIPNMQHLEVFNFPSNHFTTEQVAWLVAKCPNLKGRFLKSHTK